jgi:hypothetical protein
VIAVPLLVCLVVLPFAHGFLAATLVYRTPGMRLRSNGNKRTARPRAAKILRAM